MHLRNIHSGLYLAGIPVSLRKNLTLISRINPFLVWWREFSGPCQTRDHESGGPIGPGQGLQTTALYLDASELVRVRASASQRAESMAQTLSHSDGTGLIPAAKGDSG